MNRDDIWELILGMRLDEDDEEEEKEPEYDPHSEASRDITRHHPPRNNDRYTPHGVDDAPDDESTKDSTSADSSSDARYLRRCLEPEPAGSSREAAHVYAALAFPKRSGLMDEAVSAIEDMAPAYRRDVMSILARVAEPNLLMQQDINVLEKHMERDSWANADVRQVILRLNPQYANARLRAAARRGMDDLVETLLQPGVDTRDVLEAALSNWSNPDNVKLAEKLLSHHLRFEDPKSIHNVINSGSMQLLNAWIDHTGAQADIAKYLGEGLYLAAANGKGEMVKRLLEAGALASGSNIKILNSLSRHHAIDAIWNLMGHGVVFDSKHPLKNIDIIKSTALEHDLQKKYTRQFDRIVEALRADKRFHGTIPWVEGLTEDDVTNRTAEYRDFVAFARAVQFAHRLAGAIDPEHMKDKPSHYLIDLLANLNTPVRRDWEPMLQSGALHKLHPSQADEFQDCLRHVATMLIMPEFVRELHRRGRTMETVDFEQAIDRLLPTLAKQIAGNRSIPTLFRLARRWDSSLSHLSLMHLTPPDAKWPSLTADWQDESGYTITFLTTPRELKQEGGAQHHCAGTFARSCYYSNHHMASIRSRSGEILTTVLFSLDEHDKLKVLDHRFSGNVRPEAGSLPELIVDRFKKAFHNGEAKLNPEVRKHRHNVQAAKRGYDFIAWLGFDPRLPPQAKEIEIWHGDQDVERKTVIVSDDTYFQEVLKHVNEGGDKPLIIGGRNRWHDKTCRQFLEETGLMQEIEALAAQPPRRAMRRRSDGG